MELVILTGRPGSGKSGRVYREAARELREGREALVLVPEQFTLEAEALLIEALDRPGFLQQPVMSPTRLTRAVFEKSGRAMPQAMDERGRAMAVQRVAGQLGEALPLLGRSARNARFAGEVSQLLGDMKRFDITAEALEAAAGRGSQLLKRKGAEIAALYRAFDEFLHRQGLMDGEDRFNRLIDGLSEARWLSNTRVFIDGFDQYPPQWLRLILALCCCARSVTVTVTLAEEGAADGDIFLTGQLDALKMTQAAQEAGIPVKRVHLRRKAQGMLEALPQQIFAYPARPVADDGSVTVLCADDEEGQAEAAAALCRRWAVEGVPFGEMVVACTDLPTQGPRIRRIFEKTGLSVFFDSRVDLLEHPLVGLLLTALTAVDKGWRQQELLVLSKNPLLRLTQAQREAFEIYVKDYGIKGPIRMGRPFVRPSQGVDMEEADAARELLARGLKRLPRRKQATREWTQALLELAEIWQLEGALEDYARLADGLGAAETAAQSLQALEQVQTILEQLAFLLPDERMTGTELTRLLEAGFGAAQVGILPTRGDAVLVGDIGRTKVARARHLVVIGAVEGRLPLPHGEGALFHDRDLAALNDAGLPLGRDGRIRNAQSKLAVADILSRAEESITLIYCRTNESGQSLNPSQVVTRILALTGIPVRETTGWENGSPRMQLTQTMRALGRARAKHIPPEAAAREALATLLAFDPMKSRVTAMIDPPPERAPRGLSVDELSVSRLEKYAQCPMAWFVRYVLAPEEWPRHTADARNIGTFTHEALALLGRQPQALADEEEAARTMEQIAFSLKDQFFSSSMEDSSLDRHSFEAMTEACVRTARAMARQLMAGSFTPRAMEAPLPADAALRLSQGERIPLKGTVDRVDVCGDLVRVMDYKTGQTKLQPVGVLDGTQLQLWIYLKALLDEDKSRRPAGVYYIPARDPLSKEDPLKDDQPSGITVNDPEVIDATDGEAAAKAGSSVMGFTLTAGGSIRGGYSRREVEGICRIAMDTAARLGEEMKEGRVEPRPAGNVCDYCPYIAFCQRQLNPPQPAQSYKRSELRRRLDDQKESGGDHDPVDR